jgi:hypothetical protein
MYGLVFRIPIPSCPTCLNLFSVSERGMFHDSILDVFVSVHETENISFTKEREEEIPPFGKCLNTAQVLIVSVHCYRVALSFPEV